MNKKKRNAALSFSLDTIWYWMQTGLQIQNFPMSQNKGFPNNTRLWKLWQLNPRSYIQYVRGYSFIMLALGSEYPLLHRSRGYWEPSVPSKQTWRSVALCRLLFQWDGTFWPGRDASVVSSHLAGRQERGDQWHFGSRNIPGGGAKGSVGGALPHLLAPQPPPAIKINLILIAVVIQFVSAPQAQPSPTRVNFK